MDEVTKKLLDWFRGHHRHLPWRESYNPYQVWISEIMLQQTQMDRVVPFFVRWQERFPDVMAIAEADPAELNKYWEGLGYYSRVRNIRKCAEVILRDHGGLLPDTHQALLALPGIGEYTAAAIMSIAFQADYVVVDGNVKRLFCRLFDLDQPVKEPAVHEFCRQKGLELLPKGGAREYNQALMELGALVCRPGQPDCGICPLVDSCLSLARGTVPQRPIPSRPQSLIPMNLVVAVILCEGLIYIRQRPTTGRWGNLWEFPGGEMAAGETPRQTLSRAVGADPGFIVKNVKVVGRFQTSFTKYRIVLRGYSCELPGPLPQGIFARSQNSRWLPLAELDQYAYPSAHRQLLNHLLANSRQ
ncbi:MAG: A/G-specific adenine glycosylase [Proteobacteria bacterium]|nr:A/G-specific adenine glycosylase [Pseudomonadota bacterium]